MLTHFDLRPMHWVSQTLCLGRREREGVCGEVRWFCFKGLGLGGLGIGVGMGWYRIEESLFGEWGSVMSEVRMR